MSPDPRTGSATSPLISSKSAAWGNAIVVGLALVAVLSAVRTILSLRGHTPLADYAGWQMQLGDMPGRIPLTGSYSRLGWDHPGPLMTWITFPFAAVAPVTGMFIAALAVNVAGLIVAARAALCALGERAGLVAVVVLAVWAVVGLDDLLVDPWNPRLTVVATLAAALCLAAVAGGAHHYVYGVVVFASLTAQLHVAGLLPGAAMIAAALWIARGSLLRPALVLVALWIGPLIDLVAGQHNLYHVLRYALTNDQPRNGAANAVRTLTVLFDPWHGAGRGVMPLGANGQVDHAVRATGVVALVIVVAIAGFVVRRGHRAIGWILFAGIAMAGVSLAGVDLPVFAHVVAWPAMLVPLAGVVIAAAAMDAFDRAPQWRVLLPAAAAVLVAVLMVAAVRGSTPRRVTSLSVDPLGALASVVVDAAGGQPVVVADDDVPNTGLVVGVVAVVESRGGRALLDGAWGEYDKFGARRSAHAGDACRAHLLMVRRPAGVALPPPSGERLIELPMSDPRGRVALDRIATASCP